jgi:hypothetical protein
MKKRKFNTGGEFELSPEALAAGLRMGRNENIRPEDREAAIEETTGPGSKGFKRLTDKEAADLMGREVNMPEAVAIPVAAPRRMTGRALDEGTPESYTAPRSTVAAPAPRLAPSRGDYSRNGPIGDLIDAATAPKGKVTPRPRMVPSADEGARITSRKPKPMSRADKAERDAMNASPFKKGGAVKASKRADGIAQRGKTKGRML